MSVSFKDYYLGNMGKLFKSFETNINNHHFYYDIYWGDPDIIFDNRVLYDIYPLAVTMIPQSTKYPNSRIFIHEKLDLKFKHEFKIVLAHEIGHLWLHDVVGINHRMTTARMEEHEAEIWADYFAFRTMQKYSEISSLDSFNIHYEKISNLQVQ